MRLDGIARVETDVIPDHVLIDYDGSRLKEKALADIVNELSAPHGRCRAAVMESCITAGVEGHVASSPAR